jgi:hypothetical protein
VPQRQSGLPKMQQQPALQRLLRRKAEALELEDTHYIFSNSFSFLVPN